MTRTQTNAVETGKKTPILRYQKESHQQHRGKHEGHVLTQTWVQILSCPLFSWVTLSKAHIKLSRYGTIYIYFIGLL